MKIAFPSSLLILVVLFFISCNSDNDSGPDPDLRNCNLDFGDPSQSEYILPFQVGETYKVIQSYCPPNPNWGHHNWFAYDFDMQIGDSIVATRSGTVLFVEESKLDGTRECGGGTANWIFVEHVDRTVMQYVHLTTNGALVDEGDDIIQGQVIGLSGDSGCSTGPHLHIALFKDRTNFDGISTIPLNFKNSDGPLDTNRGLKYNALYSALSY